VTAVITEVAGPPEPPEEPAQGTGKIAGRSPRALAWARLRRDKVALVCLGFIVFIVVVAIFARPLSHLIGQGPYKPDRGPNGLSPNGIPVGPSTHHWLGTDDQGRDILSRLMFGAQVSMIVGLVATVIEIALGIVVGLIAGFYGGKVDSFLSRFMDVVLSFPFLLTALAMAARFGNHLYITIGVIAFFSWSQPGRLVRGQVLALREREFVEAARSLGSSDRRIMFVDILPNLIAPVMVYGTLLIPINIVAESTLSFLGLGVTIPKASWGQMLSDASSSGLYTTAWWFLVFPGLALLLTTLAFNLLGDGLRDALDPRFDRIGKK
jgi:ABC-type dipeptide/oligopeptide/nickel transport system permease subunit